jgi:hypothetical protein
VLGINAVALREWAVTCDALDAGEQLLLLRTGGIHERVFLERDADRIAVSEHREFWLVPTYLHASSERLKRRARERVDILRDQAPAEGTARIRLYATVEDLVFIDDRDRLDALDPFHHWELDYVRSRYDFRTPGLWALLLRAWRSAEPLTRELNAEHAGCVSWLRLAPELETGGLEPVLGPAQFEQRRAELLHALGQDGP